MTKELILKEEYIIDDNFEITLRKDEARLFNETERITWGEVVATKTSTGEKETLLFIASDLIVKFPNPKAQILSPNDPDFKTNGEKKYKLIFFSNESDLIKEVAKLKSDLRNEVLAQFVSFLIVFMVIFCVIMTFLLFRLANAITRPVIELYELIRHIVTEGKGKKRKLSFKRTNDELNNLHLTFNRIATTL